MPPDTQANSSTALLSAIVPPSLARGLLAFLCFLACALSAPASEPEISAGIVVVAVEGTVKAKAIDEDFEITLDETSIGKSLDENFILSTGKDGRCVLLFTNGVLATVKPNGKLFVREFRQESFSAKDVPPPAEMTEEPGASHLKLHLDFGDMVVKAPKMSKDSSLMLSSPLGTAGIRGTMFQMVIARNPETGDVSGGLNLISGDIEFTDVAGNVTTLASGESMEIGASKLGDVVASPPPSELLDLSGKYGPALSGEALPPMVSNPGPADPAGRPSDPPDDTVLPGTPADAGWNDIHSVATAAFFAIEQAEAAVSDVTFADIAYAVSVTTPTPRPSAPGIPDAITGGALAPPDPYYGSHPIVDLKGSDTMSLEMGEPFVDPGVTVKDFAGVDRTSTARLLNPPDVTTPGTYKLTYAGNDFRGLQGTNNRTVQVIVTPPTITLTGGELFQHSVQSRNVTFFPDTGRFTEPGYTAHDYKNRDLTAFVEVTGATAVTDSTPGTFQITYTVNDKSTRGIGLPSGTPVTTTVTRTVEVKDLTSPIIQLHGSDTVTVEAATSYADEGAKAIDNYDGENTLTPIIQATSTVNLMKTGAYSVLYDVTDSSGNKAATVKRTVNVVDTTAPALAIYGQAIDFVDLNASYRDVGAFATDTLDGDISANIVVTDPIPNAIATKTIGTYVVKYEVSDATGNAATPVTRTVVLRGNDGKGPQITLLGDNPLTLEVGTAYVEPGATAFKDMGAGRDPILYEVKNVSGIPNMNKLGSTTVSYLAEDEFGNQMTATREVIVRDTTAPVIYPNKTGGETHLTLEAGVGYSDDGAVALDNYDGDLTAKITTTYREKDKPETTFDATKTAAVSTSGFVDPSKEYEVVYQVQDESNNTGTTSRTLKVYDVTAPTVSLEALPTNLQLGIYASADGKTISIVDDVAEVIFDQSSLAAATKTTDSLGRETLVQGAFLIRNKTSGTTLLDDPGFKVSDNAIGSMTPTIQTSLLATTETGVVSKYKITYRAQDAAGNLSSTLERTIYVLTGPRITLLGASEIVIVNGKNETESTDYATTGYADAGATAKDALGNDITNLADPYGLKVRLDSFYDAVTKGVTASNIDLGSLTQALAAMKAPTAAQPAVDLTKTGKFDLAFNALDANSIPAPSVNRTIYVVGNDGVAPTVTPRRGTNVSAGVWETTLDVNASGSGVYSELGATASKTRHAGLGSPYELSQSWDEANASSSGTVTSSGNVPAKFGPGTVEGSPYQVSYSIKDQFGNEGAATLNVTVRDQIAPTIVPATFTSGSTDLTLEANASYADPGFTATDNYYTSNLTSKVYFLKNLADANASAVRTIDPYSLGATISHDAATIQTWNLTDFGKFYVRYGIADPSGNQKVFHRTITVQDTTAPIVTLQPDSGGALTPIQVNQDLSHLTPPGTSSSYAEHGIFVTDNSINPTGSPLSFTSSGTNSGITVSIDASAVKMQTPGQYDVTYTVTDSSGNKTVVTRKVWVLDKETPSLSASISSSTTPFTANTINYAIAEAGTQYDDDAGQTIKVWNGSDANSTMALTLAAADTQDGTISSKITRTIYKKDSGGSYTQVGIVKNNDVSSVPSLIPATTVDDEYEIRYDVQDSAENNATPLYRRVIVKDTLPPVIQPSDVNTTLLVDYKSTANPNVNDVSDVTKYVVSGFSAVDANNFDQNLGSSATMANGDLKWTVSFNPAYVPGALYPTTRNGGAGYEITIRVQDASGNLSDPVIRYLKVGDFDPPTITLMGKSEIHDFLRFTSNTTSNTNQAAHANVTGSTPQKNAPHLDRLLDAATNPERNATGFAGGEHRMLLADYDFVDPGAYGEDANAYWDVKSGFPDLDGDGIGEGYAIQYVTDRAHMDECSKGAGIIHVFSSHTKTSGVTLQTWQDKMVNNEFGYTSNAKTPDVNASDATLTGGPYDFNDTSKTDTTNFDVVNFLFEYRVMDGWLNKSSIVTRQVYFYESRQFGSFAFYATPLTTQGGDDFEAYHKDPNASATTPYLTSMRKDTDGDGVSDYWEAIHGTDYKDPASKPDALSSSDTWNLLNSSSASWAGSTGKDWSSGNKDNTWLLNRLGALNDSTLLKSQSWVTGLDSNHSHVLSQLP